VHSWCFCGMKLFYGIFGPNLRCGFWLVSHCVLWAFAVFLLAYRIYVYVRSSHVHNSMNIASKSRLHIGRDVCNVRFHVCLFNDRHLVGMFVYASLFFFCCAGQLIGWLVVSSDSARQRIVP